MSERCVLPTDNGKVFNIKLDAGYCFAMSLDVAKVLLEYQELGKGTKIPTQSALSPGKWAIVQSAYEINDDSNDEKLILAQNLCIKGRIDPTAFHGDFAAVAGAITALHGTSVFAITGNGEGHALLWHRDDANGIWLHLDPNDGLWQFDNSQTAAAHHEAETFIANGLAKYVGLDGSYDAFTLTLS